MQLLGQEFEKQQRRGVGPVQIVQNQGIGHLLRGFAEELAERRQRCEIAPRSFRRSGRLMGGCKLEFRQRAAISSPPCP